MTYTYNFPMPALTVDIVYKLCSHKALHILLIKRKETSSKYPGYWALPGGYMNIDETLLKAAHRELFEETNITPERPLEFEFIEDDPNRDPSGRVVTAVFSGHSWNDHFIPGDDAQDCCWCSVFQLPILAFDHNAIVNRLIGYDVCTNEKDLHPCQPTYNSLKQKE